MHVGSRATSGARSNELEARSAQPQAGPESGSYTGGGLAPDVSVQDEREAAPRQCPLRSPCDRRDACGPASFPHARFALTV